MNFRISFQPAGDFSRLLDCFSSLEKFQPQKINLIVDASEVVAHWEKFQRTLFEADLLGINGVFIQGELAREWKEKVDELYSKSIFNTFEKVVFLDEEFVEMELPKRKTNEETLEDDFKWTNQIRTIVVWDGADNLKPETKVNIDFHNSTSIGKVMQVQKVINTDFNGSRFGINKLGLGEIGTTTWMLDHPIEMHYYQDQPTQGIFKIKDKKNKSTGYGIIIR